MPIRPHRRVSGAVAAVLLLAACGNAEGTPQPGPRVEGVQPTAQAPAPALLATDRVRSSPGVIVSGGPDAPYNYGPTVLVDDGSYRMWWCSQLPGVGVPGDDVLSASAPALDGPYGAPTVDLHGGGSGFDAKHTCDPSVIKVSGSYYLYYTGAAGEQPFGNSIGLITSADGVHWTKLGHPVVEPSMQVHGENTYGAGQPSALYLDGWVYLMFTDTTGAAAGPKGTGQFVLRSKDPTFATGTQALTPNGFAEVSGTRSARTTSISDSNSSDWMWVDALNAFAVAHEALNQGTVITFWNRDFTAHPYGDVLVAGPWQEGAGLVRRADGHAPASAQDRCGRVPIDLVRAVRETSAPTDLTHFGLDLLGVHACQPPATLDGVAMPSSDRTIDLVLAGHRVRVDRRAVAEQLAVRVLDEPVPSAEALPLAGRIAPGVPALHAPNRPYGLVLDGRLWPVGPDPVVVRANSSPVTETSDQQWDAYPKGLDLTVLRD
ncbi:hypothetical protein KALB_2745 [Kutzneria albida DSM 43870]|uniref:Beta-xylosidase n=1 Tax=Kutzneria albida DSM 43870 TaxID=1449976 RepID=W5W4E5_9PSEU|nr:hypothetical protein KALB_2745 [Kutzneria albida DSM 43870]